MRTLFVLVIIVYGIFNSFRGPFYGLMFYLWIAYFRPEYWLWSDWVSQLNLSLIVGVFVLISTVLWGPRLRFGVGPCLMLLLLAQGLMSTLMSPAFSYAWPYWQDFAKSTIISCLIVTLVDSERALRLTLLVIAGSLGLEAVKQGWVQLLLNPGAVNTNDIIVLGDNNGVAVGMFMLVGILIALARTAPGRTEKLAHRFAAVGVLYRGISTFSRGGFLACGAFGLHFLISARRRFAAAVWIAIVCLLIVPVLSDAYWERMGTIAKATEDLDVADETSGGRVHMWQTAIAMANDRPLTGVGHNAFIAMYDQYDTSAGDYGRSRAAHSSWFAVLADLGYPGLLLYVLVIANAFWTCRRARLLAKKHPELLNLGYYATAIEGALVAFVVGGTFVTFQYVELLWHMFALSMVVDRLVAERVRILATAPRTVAPEPVRARIGVAAATGRPVRV